MPGFRVDGQDSFVSKLALGGARASLFQAQFTIGNLGDQPKAGVIDNTTFTYLCKGIQIPSTSVGIVNVNFMGRAVKLPGVKVFEDMTTTILNDEDYALRNKIESWMAKINSHFGNVRATSHVKKLGTDGGYSTDMTITAKGKSGGDIGKWTLYNCFPTSLDQIDVNWEPNDAIMEYAVTWAYDYWLMDGVNST